MRPGHLRHRSIEGGLNGVLSAKCSQPVVVVRGRERRETSFLAKWLHQTSVHVQEFLWLNSHLRCLHQTLQVAHHHHGQGPGDEARGASPHRPVQRCHKPKCNWTIYPVRIRTVEASLTTRTVVRSAKLNVMQSSTANCAKACVFVTQFVLASFSHARVRHVQ